MSKYERVVVFYEFLLEDDEGFGVFHDTYVSKRICLWGHKE
jgi:hypothetical protein